MSGTCFIIMPFGGQFDEYYTEILAPSIQLVGLQPIRADEIYKAGAIINDIMNAINDAEIIIADVTSKNPNVNYELGFAHALGKPVIIISQTIEDVPFDYRHLRTIIYNTSKVRWADELSDRIKKTIQSVQANPADCIVWPPTPKTQKVSAIVTVPDKQKDYTISSAENPDKAVFRGYGQFIKLQSRYGEIDQYMIDIVLEAIEDLENIQAKLTNEEFIQIRSILFDNKHGWVRFIVDLIHDSGIIPSMTQEELESIFANAEYCRQCTSAECRIIKTNIYSDHFSKNSPEYYKDVD